MKALPQAKLEKIATCLNLPLPSFGRPEAHSVFVVIIFIIVAIQGSRTVENAGNAPLSPDLAATILV
jgi:hypothetical protein